MDKKPAIIGALYTFIGQRPGLEYGNYGGRASYQSEMRAITKDLHQARQLLRYVELRASITADDIIAASKNAYSGRLTISDDATIDYCTGQYFPTEYRKAACAVLSQAIREWYRASISDTANPGDYLRASFKREFGRGMAARWFN